MLCGLFWSHTGLPCLCFGSFFCFRCVQGFEFRVVTGSGMVKSGLLLSLEMIKGAFCVRTLCKVELHGR